MSGAAIVTERLSPSLVIQKLWVQIQPRAFYHYSFGAIFGEPNVYKISHGGQYENQLLLFQNCYIHLAVSCLEQLRVRELYDLLPLESLCYAVSLRSKEVTR